MNIKYMTFIIALCALPLSIIGGLPEKEKIVSAIPKPQSRIIPVPSAQEQQARINQDNWASIYHRLDILEQLPVKGNKRAVERFKEMIKEMIEEAPTNPISPDQKQRNNKKSQFRQQIFADILEQLVQQPGNAKHVSYIHMLQYTFTHKPSIDDNEQRQSTSHCIPNVKKGPFGLIKRLSSEQEQALKLTQKTENLRKQREQIKKELADARMLPFPVNDTARDLFQQLRQIAGNEKMVTEYMCLWEAIDEIDALDNIDNATQELINSYLVSLATIWVQLEHQPRNTQIIRRIFAEQRSSKPYRIVRGRTIRSLLNQTSELNN